MQVINTTTVGKFTFARIIFFPLQIHPEVLGLVILTIWPGGGSVDPATARGVDEAKAAMKKSEGGGGGEGGRLRQSLSDAR